VSVAAAAPLPELAQILVEYGGVDVSAAVPVVFKYGELVAELLFVKPLSLSDTTNALVEVLALANTLSTTFVSESK
jgi:hypothetical protein